MDATVIIRYRTPWGVENDWAVPVEKLCYGTTDAAKEAFLKHWHPTYTYVPTDKGSKTTTTR